MDIDEIKKIIGNLKLKNVLLDDYRKLSDNKLHVLITGGYNYDVLEYQLEYLDQIKTILKSILNSYIYKLEVDNADDVYYLDLIIE